MTQHASSYFLASLLMLVMSHSHLANAQSLNEQAKKHDSIVSISAIDQANLAKIYSDQVSGKVELSDAFDLAFTAQLHCQATSTNSNTVSKIDHIQLQAVLNQMQSDPKIALQHTPSIDLVEAMILNMIANLSTYQSANQSCLINTFSTELITKADLQS